jgi:GNAT superfamily N-acetyltransferase
MAADPEEHLTHGWEPDLAVRDTVLRAFLFAFADRLATMAQAVGGQIRRTPEAAFADPHSAFVFDNGVILLQPPGVADVHRVVEEAVAFYPPERTWILFSAWPLPDLSAAGLDLVGHPPLLLRASAPFTRPDPVGSRIIEVGTAEELADFERVLVEGYPMPEGGAIIDHRLLGGAVRLWVGYDENNRAVAVSGAHVAHGLIEVDWVAVLPQVRGRGYGAALTGRAVRCQPDFPAVLVASDDGRPVYERLGFLPISRCTVWMRPGRT